MKENKFIGIIIMRNFNGPKRYRNPKKKTNKQIKVEFIFSLANSKL